MGRRPGSRNKPKGTPPADAVPGHNRPPAELTEDQRRALGLQHKREYKKALEAKKAADAGFKQACKRIKSEGGVLSKIKKLILAETPEGEASLRAEMEETRSVFEWVGVEVGEQAVLFPTDRRPSEDRAREAGKVAGLEGLDPAPPHDPSVPQYGAWLDGYEEGQEVNRSLLAAMKQPDAIPESDFEAPSTVQ